MRQAQTLNEAQLRRVIQYCRSRRHPVRDETIVLFSFYAELGAKEVAALKGITTELTKKILKSAQLRRS